MLKRRFSTVDRLITEADNALRVAAAAPQAARPAPDAAVDKEADEQLSATERKLSARLMRVNHAGEIAAQALYRGQASVARDAELQEALLEAASEEHDHLAWCQDRSTELGAGPSRLTPFWYAGSFAIGVLAGLAGDRTSLGFLAETERQVSAHLDGHLDALPAADLRSRAIVEQMRSEEQAHMQGAERRGGRPLPEAARRAMRAASKVMTTVAFRL